MGQVEQLSARGVPRDAVRFLGETTNGAETTVRTVLMYPDEMPIDFVMSRRGARWEVHDVFVDGVSATENYGAQFRRITAKDSFAGLVDRMSARTATPPDSRVTVPR
jgi:ABC-type transporter MlaC component